MRRGIQVTGRACTGGMFGNLFGMTPGQYVGHKKHERGTPDKMPPYRALSVQTFRALAGAGMIRRQPVVLRLL